MVGGQVDGAIAIDDHDAVAGVTVRVRIPALPPDRQYVVVRVPAGTVNKTVLLLPGVGFGSPPGDLRIQVLVRAPVSRPPPAPPPRRPPDGGRPRSPVAGRLTGLPLALVILIFIALLGLGPGLLAAGIMGTSSPGPAVPTCNGRVMSRSDECEVTSNGTVNVYDYGQMLAQERRSKNIGVGFQIAVGIVCSCLLVLLTAAMFVLRRRRRLAG